MDTKQAKDFLVEQVVQQAVLDKVQLSDLEKRMMYFTEADPLSCPDPISLNGKFESQYKTEQYEAKMSALLDRAYKRLQNANLEQTRLWDEAVAELEKGDHYVLVMLGVSSSPVVAPRPKYDFLKLIGTALVLVDDFSGGSVYRSQVRD